MRAQRAPAFSSGSSRILIQQKTLRRERLLVTIPQKKILDLLMSAPGLGEVSHLSSISCHACGSQPHAILSGQHANYCEYHGLEFQPEPSKTDCVSPFRFARHHIQSMTA